MVPLAGSRSSRAAQEIGGYLSAKLGTHLHQIHIPTRPGRGLENFLGDHAPHSPDVRRILAKAAQFASSIGANHTTVAEPAPNAGAHIDHLAKELDADLIVLAGTSRSGTEDLFLGHTIHHVLENSTVTVVVAITPDPDNPSTDSVTAADSDSDPIAASI